MTIHLKYFGLVGLVFSYVLKLFMKLVVLIGTSLLIWKKLTYVGNLKTKVIKLCVSLNHLFFMLEEGL